MEFKQRVGVGKKRVSFSNVKSNKERAREHRLRKKEYIRSLEEENKQLKIRVNELKHGLKEIKQQTKDCPIAFNKFETFFQRKNSSFEENKEENIVVLLDKLKEEVSFQENKIPQILRTNPENVRYAMFEELNDITGEFGSLRIKILKKAFWMFLENILPNCSNVELL
jgi:chromosome segregation ATPase